MATGDSHDGDSQPDAASADPAAADDPGSSGSVIAGTDMLVSSAGIPPATPAPPTGVSEEHREAERLANINRDLSGDGGKGPKKKPAAAKKAGGKGPKKRPAAADAGVVKRARGSSSGSQ